MKKKALHKTVFTEIFKSKARFLSILGIIMLGVGFYAGIKATGPDMNRTGNQYFEDKRLMDLKIVSTMGLTENDINQIKKAAQIEQLDALYSKDINLTNENQVVHLFAYDNKQKESMNDYQLVRGRLPKKSGEIALDQHAFKVTDYKIGDTFKLISDQELTDFNQTSYKIVGEVISPLYIEVAGRGTANVGKGSIDYFGVISKEDFSLDVYTEVYLRFKNVRDMDTFSKKYEDCMAENEKQMKTALKDRPAQRIEEIKTEVGPKLAEGRDKIATSEEQLLNGQRELDNNQLLLEDARQQLTTAELEYQQKIAAGEHQLTTSREQLRSAEQTLTAKKQELAVASGQLIAGQNELATNRQQLQTKAAEWEIQKQTLQTTAQQLNSAIQGYQTVQVDMQATANLSDEEFQQVILPKLAEWEGILTSLQAPAEVISGLQQVAQQPNQAAIGQLAATLGGATPQLQAQVEQVAAGINQGEQALLSGRQQLAGAEQELASGQQQLAVGQQQIAAAETQLINGKNELQNGEAELQAARVAGRNQLAIAEDQLVSGEAAYQQGLTAFNDQKAKAEPELQQAREQLAAQEEQLATLKPPTFYYAARDQNPGFSGYDENAQRISSIASVFPVFFFLIAALVSLTTMTRMVEEQRSEIGTLKALGYRNWEIAQKYIVYATSASLIGAALGLIIGYRLFPELIYNAYGSLYNLPPLLISSYPSYTIQSIGVALLCTTLSALLVLRVDLISTPATLLRPKSPKAGQRIFLERIPFIWQRLNFNHKVTARNLFRYKQRMLMTILGVAGCMALIITGFGVKDSISDIVNIQFQKIWHYQAIVTLNTDAKEEENENYRLALAKMPQFDKQLTIGQQSLQAVKKGVNNQTVTINVPEEPKKIADFTLFNDRKTGKKYQLTNDGAIIDEKLANLYSVKAGDTLTLKDSNQKSYKIKVAHVIENYAMHFAYMTPEYYQQIFEKKPVYNTDYLLLKNLEKPDQLAADLMENEEVLNVSFLSDMSSSMNDTMDSLNVIVWVLIICAALLAFIVLYNLTNINISERIRELSTIKVLGFYNREVTAYVYRENIILTLLGILVGSLFGRLLHRFVLETAEVDFVMFPPDLHFQSYLYSGILTILFACIVMIFMHRKLKKINMIEALKSTD